MKLSDIPSGSDEITPEWLTHALRSAGIIKNGSVIAVENREPDITGMAGLVTRLNLRYDTMKEGAPASIIAKSPSPVPHLRRLFGELGFYENELMFYNKIADLCGLRVPRCYYAKVDTGKHNYLLLLEDIAPVARVGDMVAGCSRRDAELAITHIAGFHARFWQSPDLKPLMWIQSSEQRVEAMRETYSDSWLTFLERCPSGWQPSWPNRKRGRWS